MVNDTGKTILENLYKSETILTDLDGKEFEIPVSGSLGILAIGYRGLIAWRKKKIEKAKKEKNQNSFE